MLCLEGARWRASSSSSSGFTLSSSYRVDMVGGSFSLHGAYFRPLPSLCGVDVSRLRTVSEPPTPPAPASPLQRLKGSSAITTLVSSNTACYFAAQTRRKVCSPLHLCVQSGLSCCLCVSISRYSTGSSCLHLHLLKPAWWQVWVPSYCGGNPQSAPRPCWGRAARGYRSTCWYSPWDHSQPSSSPSVMLQ